MGGKTPRKKDNMKQIIKYDNESGEYRTANYKNKYRVVDAMEGIIVGRCETLEQARKIEDLFWEDTDGECELYILKYSETAHKFEYIK